MYQDFKKIQILLILGVVIFYTDVSSTIAFASDGLTDFECQRRTALPCVEVQYGPFSGIFGVDTGASLSAAYGSSRFQDIPATEWEFKQLDMQFAVGSATVSMIENISVSAFGADALETRLVIVEQPERSPLNAGIEGILGLRELRQMKLQINGVKPSVTRLDSAWRPNEFALNVPLTRRGERDVAVPIRVLDGNQSICVDTGCRSFMLLSSAMVKFFEQIGKAAPANKVTFATAVDIREVQMYIVKSVTIAGCEFRDVPAFESSVNAIGMGCFSHFDMVLDFPKNEMWLTPLSDDWPKRVPPDASGLVLGFLDTNVLSLLRIQPDSAASKSDLKIDDQILLFDGKEPKDLSMYEIHQRQTQAGTILPLRIRRGDQEMDIRLPLGYSFEYPPKWSNDKNVLDEFGEFLEKDESPAELKPAVPER